MSARERLSGVQSAETKDTQHGLARKSKAGIGSPRMDNLPSYIRDALQALGSTAPRAQEFATVSVYVNSVGCYVVGGSIGGPAGWFASDFWIDTGAGFVTLRQSSAAAIGIITAPSDFTVSAQTANGVVWGASVTVPRVTVSGITRNHLPGLVLRDEHLFADLLGMSFISTLRQFDINNGWLTLAG